MKQVPDRPELLASERWFYDHENLTSSVIYEHVKGTTPEVTNHLSWGRLDVVSGSGRLALGYYGVVPLEAGQSIDIPRGRRHQLSGDIGYLLTSQPAYDSDYVTARGQKLRETPRRVALDLANFAQRQPENRDKLIIYATHIVNSLHHAEPYAMRARLHHAEPHTTFVY